MLSCTPFGLIDVSYTRVCFAVLCVQYQMEDIVACSDIGLKGHDCDSFEQAVYMGQSAVAMAILIVGFMVVNLWIAFGNKHNRILWFFQLSSAAANALFGCLAFAACGYFNDVLDALPSYGSNPSLGYGWGLELLTAFSAFISAALCILVLVKGIGENEANGGHNVL